MGEDLPFGTLLCSWTNELATSINVAIYRESERAAFVFNINVIARSVQSIQLASKCLAQPGPRLKILSATPRGDTLFVIYQNSVEAFDIATGAWQGEANVPAETSWIRNRFFFDRTKKWLTLCFDGAQVGFEGIPFGKTPSGDVVGLFDRCGKDGPFAICHNGTIVNLSDQSVETLLKVPKSKVSVLDVDSRGERLLIKRSLSGAPEREEMTIAVDLHDRKELPGRRHTTLVEFDAAQFRSNITTIHRLSRVHIWDGRLVFMTKNQTYWKLFLRGDNLLFGNCEKMTMPLLEQSFEPVNRPGVLYSLQQATWNDGSRVWIDSRGLLHLRSSDRSIPEATFLLVEGSVAAWISDGRMFGSYYFVNQDLTRMTPGEIDESILRPFVSWLR